MSARILDAAAQCMRRSGVKVAMQEVAAVAGVSRGAVYRHFAGREALVEAVMERNASDLLQATAQQVDVHEGLAAQVAEAIRVMPGSTAEPLATALLEEPKGRTVWLAERWQGFWLSRLAAAQERGEVRDDLSLAAAADWVTRIQISFVMVDAERGMAGDGEGLERYIDQNLLRGLGA